MVDKFCQKCGAKLKKEDLFCRECGTKINEEHSNNEKNISKSNEGIFNKIKNINKKQKIIIGIILLIIAIALILALSGVFGDSPSHIKNVKVYKADKIYKIEFSCDIPYDTVMVTLYKDGEALYNSKGSLGESSESGGSSVAIELVKDVDIDEILFTVFDEDMQVLDSGHVKDFNIEKKGSMSEIGVYKEDNSKKTANDIYEETEWDTLMSHRDKYDYDGDGMLNDYEFQKFCEGEGQEELLDY